MRLSINKKWKWAAMDKDGRWTFYVAKPFIDYDEWAPIISAEESIPGRQFMTVSSIIEGFPSIKSWQDSLHQIINNQLVKFELPKEPQAVIRAREILEECGIVDVQGTPADQLKPLVDLIEEVAIKRYDRYQDVPDATMVLSVEGETSIKFHKSMTLTTAEFDCYLVKKNENSTQL